MQVLSRTSARHCSPTRPACGVLTVTKGYRLGLAERAVPPSCRDRFPPKILVPRSWYQKKGEPVRRSLLVCRGARGAAGPPPGGLGGWKPPRNSRGSGGWQSPSKNNFMVLLFPNVNFEYCFGKGETYAPLSDRVFERPGLSQVKSFREKISNRVHRY